MKSLDIKFLIPDDMEMEDLVEALSLGLDQLVFNRGNGSIFTEVDEVLIRDRLVIIREKK